MLGHHLEMSCAKFPENQFRINGEIDEKHALQIIVSLTILLCYIATLSAQGSTLHVRI